MGNYTTVATVRRTCGITSSLINDADVGGIITEAEKKVDRFMNSTSVPREVIERLDGNYRNTIMVDGGPLLRLVELKIDGTSITPRYVYTYNSGKLILSSEAEKGYFTAANPQEIVVKYIYGYMETDTSVQTTTTDDASAGSGVSVDVSDSSDFSANDWVEIVGMDGYREVTQIDSIADGTHITADLTYNHESDSVVTKMDVPEVVKRFANIIASLALVARVVGQSYDEITGHGLGDMTIQKGEPYTQWRETAVQLERERDELKKAITPNIPFIA